MAGCVGGEVEGKTEWKVGGQGGKGAGGGRRKNHPDASGPWVWPVAGEGARAPGHHYRHCGDDQAAAAAAAAAAVAIAAAGGRQPGRRRRPAWRGRCNGYGSGGYHGGGSAGTMPAAPVSRRGSAELGVGVERWN